MSGELSATIVLGIGNRDRGDDAVGRVVAGQLRGRVPEHVEIVEHDGEATTLLAHLQGVSTAIMVDACRSGAAPGSVYRFDANQGPLREPRFGLSTHGFGLAAALELARTLDDLPCRCIVYAIEGQRFDAGSGLSAPVAAVVTGVARRILLELGAPEPSR
jgi:hydrogenase maturation protease